MTHYDVIAELHLMTLLEDNTDEGLISLCISTLAAIKDGAYVMYPFESELKALSTRMLAELKSDW